jgi:thiol-disulfide isomerase/thioredoxin
MARSTEDSPMKMASRKKLSALLVCLAFLAAPLANSCQPADSKQHTFEVRLADEELSLELKEGKTFVLPQLRVYDKQGRQVGDFGTDFDEDTFPKKLESILKSPSPTGADKTLAMEIKRVADSAGKPLAQLPTADFTIVEYWAEWCEPCKMQKEELGHILAAHQDLAVNVLHVEADPLKLHSSQTIIEKNTE